MRLDPQFLGFRPSLALHKWLACVGLGDVTFHGVPVSSLVGIDFLCQLPGGAEVSAPPPFAALLEVAIRQEWERIVARDAGPEEGVGRDKYGLFVERSHESFLDAFCAVYGHGLVADVAAGPPWWGIPPAEYLLPDRVCLDRCYTDAQSTPRSSRARFVAADVRNLPLPDRCSGGTLALGLFGGLDQIEFRGHRHWMGIEMQRIRRESDRRERAWVQQELRGYVLRQAPAIFAEMSRITREDGCCLISNHGERQPAGAFLDAAGRAFRQVRLVEGEERYLLLCRP